MITTSDSSVRRSGMLNQLLGVLIAHHGDVRAVPRSNRTSSTAHNPTACATSSTNERLICAPWRLGNFLASPHHQVEILAAPFWNTADRDLGRFHQQKTQYRVSLFRDVAQSSSISTRLLERH